jgi:hypothetical protein
MNSAVIEKLESLITAAFGLVAALAWNSAIQSLFDKTPWLKAGGPWAYAILVTVIAVVATIWMGRAAGKAKSIGQKVDAKVSASVSRHKELLKEKIGRIK